MKYPAPPRLVAMGLVLASACATAESPPGQPTPPEIGPSLLLSMTALPDAAGPADVITYTILMMNDMLGGPDPGASVRVVNNIPSGTTYVGGTISDGARYNSDTDQVTWVGAVPRGLSVTVSYQVRLDGVPTRAGEIENAALITDAFGRESEVRATVSL